MIIEAFADLLDINGVEAVVVYNNRAAVVDSWHTPKYNPSVFNDTGETFLHIFGLIEYMHYDLQELVVPFDRGQVFVRSHERFFVVVLSRLSLEVSLIRLALNVCFYEIDHLRRWKKWLRKQPEKKFPHINSASLDEVERIMLENMLEGKK